MKTLEEQPADATHWSTRSMATATGMSQTAVSRIWRAFGLKLHRTEAFKLSPDPQFVDKITDIVGLYLNPPEAAVVLCVDEKSQIQALDRSSPVLPLMPGVPERRTHDYVRYGTNPCAALDVASGQVLAEMTPRHRAEEFRRFLNLIDASVPSHLDVHVVLDNSSTHKTPSIQRWLAACMAEAAVLFESIGSPEARSARVSQAELELLRGRPSQAVALLVEHLPSGAPGYDTHDEVYGLFVSMQVLAVYGGHAEVLALGSSVHALLQETGMVLPSWDVERLEKTLEASSAQLPGPLDGLSAASLPPDEALALARDRLRELVTS